MGASLPSKSRGSRHQAMSEINVTPFVDVMLVLLVIFMVTAPLLTPGMEVNLPDAKAPAMTAQQDPLEITVTKNGEIYLAKTKIELGTLGEKLQAIAGENTDLRVFIKGDTSVNYGTIMQVMSGAHSAGYTNLGLITATPN